MEERIKQIESKLEQLLHDYHGNMQEVLDKLHRNEDAMQRLVQTLEQVNQRVTDTQGKLMSINDNISAQGQKIDKVVEPEDELEPYETDPLREQPQ